jgi:hypothetical protein
MKAALDSAQCIATEDPRLKESRMNFRHAAALAALVLVAGCSPNMTSVNASTRRAEASAGRAEDAAKIAEASTQDALNIATPANSMANAAEDEVRRANDAMSRTEGFYEATHPGTGVVNSILSATPKPWLLLVPPHFVGVHDPIDGLPLSQWSVGDDFDSVRECRHAKAVHVKSARQDFERETPPPHDSLRSYWGNPEELRLRYRSWFAALCIARTDLRRVSE